MCLFPKLIRNKKYTATKKNGGIIPAILDRRALYVPMGCGNCMECRKQKSREWTVRLLEDIKHEKNGKYVVLTFSNESIKELSEEEEIKGITGYELDNEIARLAIRRFCERWRKKHKKSIRHWFVTELGHNGTENIHMHGIVWTNESYDEVRKQWQYGSIWPRKHQEKKTFVSEKTISYNTKYILKVDHKNKYYKSRIFSSPGIGNGYTKRTDWKQNEYRRDKTKEYFKTKSGHKMALPIYWRNKIYSEDEREKLWMKKLDEGKRYVNGVEINIKNGEKQYWEALKAAQKKNKQLGYNDTKTDWNRKAYEEERRTMMQNKRIEAVYNIKAIEILNEIPRSNQWE